MSSRNSPLAAIFGCTGTTLNEAERRFFRDADPLGFILFARNIDSPDQVKALTAQLRETFGRNAPILIDQEGGRVQRLRPPHWPNRPTARSIGRLAGADPHKAGRAAWINARLIAAELSVLGIDVDCAPVVDVPVPGAHDIIGDRAFGEDPTLVASLGRQALDGFLAGGVLPVIKHIPGHGRAAVDSHEQCPVVADDPATLLATDGIPFRALRDAPFAMTAHVRYTGWDNRRPATLSPTVIERVIRGTLGFDNVLLSDDLGMKALEGSVADRACAAQQAGCDVVLHCSAELGEMTEIAAVVQPLAGDASRRVDRALALRRAPLSADLAALEQELKALLAEASSS